MLETYFDNLHRYSNICRDLSIKNLVYLSSEQALADLAYFIQSVNDGYKFSNNTKWIVFGGSYGGSLAAWMRSKYSHLVHGAMSASGPLLAQIDFQGNYIKYNIMYVDICMCNNLMLQNIISLLRML